QQHALAAQLTAIEMRELLELFRQLRFWTKKSADADGHRILWRPRVVVSALKVDEELRVRIIISKLFGDQQGQLRLADTTHAADGRQAFRLFGRDVGGGRYGVRLQGNPCPKPVCGNSALDSNVRELRAVLVLPLDLSIYTCGHGSTAGHRHGGDDAIRSA